MKLNDDIQDTIDTLLVLASVFLSVYKVIVIFINLVRSAYKKQHQHKVG